MLFNAPVFLFGFLPATLLLYVVLRRSAGPRAVLGLLTLASAFFYGWWNPAYLPLLAVVTLANFALGRAILAARRGGRDGRARLVLALGIAFDLALLGYFKYTDFLIVTANGVLGLALPLQHIALPLGISFFTFQKIAYLVDSARGEVEEHDLLEYAFFVMFFPQLVAGPIVHHREIFAQLRRPDVFAVRGTNLTVGLTIFIIGLFKKVVLADHIAPFATTVFAAAGAGQPLDFGHAWQGALAFAFQDYFDFSGYSDMAIGAARLFGIRLPQNFASPLRALDIADFWRRWHMTLSRFLRDYVYIPMGGNRKGRLRRYLNLIATMALGGLWHGAAWHFVLWGLSQGVLLMTNQAWRQVRPTVDRWWSRAAARLLTFLAFVLTLVTYRAASLPAALGVYRAMAGLGAATAAADRQLLPSLALWLALGLAAVWFLPNTRQLLARFRPACDYGPAERRRDPPLLAGLVPWRALEWRPGLVPALLVGGLAAVACLGLEHVSEFLYFEF